MSQNQIWKYAFFFFFFFFVWNENFVKNKKEICLSTISLKSNLQSHDGKYQIFGEMICRAKQS